MVNKEYYELLKVGLTEGEAKVYLSLSELGSNTVGPIVKKSGVAYSNIYDILERLMKKGIVSFVIKSKTKYFQAAPAGNLFEYLENKEKEINLQKRELRNVLPDLEKLQETGASQEAEVFIGKKGLRTAYEKMFKGVTKKDVNFFFYIYDESYAEDSDTFYNSIQDIVKKVTIRGISNKEYKDSEFITVQNYMDVRFVDFPIPGNIDVIKDMVMLVSWKPDIIGILIHSQSIADNFRKYFNEVWEKANKNVLRETFGSLKGWKVDAQKVKDELRKEEEIAEKRKWKK